MIGVTVTFDYSGDFDRERVIKVAAGARGMFEGMPGLRLKVFTLDQERQRAANFYVWDSEEAAKGFFTQELRDRVTSLYGVAPSIEFAEIAEICPQRALKADSGKPVPLPGSPTFRVLAATTELAAPGVIPSAGDCRMEHPLVPLSGGPVRVVPARDSGGTGTRSSISSLAPVVLHERAVRIGGSRQCDEWPHGRADALIQPRRASGDPDPQIPATRQLRGIEL